MVECIFCRTEIDECDICKCCSSCVDVNERTDEIIKQKDQEIERLRIVESNYKEYQKYTEKLMDLF